MAVTVVRGLERHLRGTVVLLIRSDDPAERLAAGVNAAIPDIWTTGLIRATGEEVVAGDVIRRDGTRWHPDDRDWETDRRLAEAERPAFISGPVTIPVGQLLMIDYSDTPSKLCAQTPVILTRHLEAAGVRNARIGLAPELSEERYAFLGSLTPLAWAGLRVDATPYQTGRFESVQLAPRLIGVASQWLRSQRPPEMELLNLVISTPVPVDWDSIQPVVTGVLGSGGYTTLIASDFSTRAAVAVLGDFRETGVTLRAAGADRNAEWIAARMREQREVIRATAADVGWAGVTSHPNPSPTATLDLPDLTISTELDAGPMWYQVLSAPQLGRLGGPPPGAVALPGDRYELTIGEPEQWVPGHPDHDAIRAEARRLFPADGPQ
jgi:hypothetical protein